jgi:hypothetical protein
MGEINAMCTKSTMHELIFRGDRSDSRILSLSLRYHDNSITRSGDIAKTLGFKPVGQIGAPTNFVHNAGRYLRSP